MIKHNDEKEAGINPASMGIKEVKAPVKRNSY